jgi:hypothetical protein
MQHSANADAPSCNLTDDTPNRQQGGRFMERIRPFISDAWNKSRTYSRILFTDSISSRSEKVLLNVSKRNQGSARP